MKMHGNLDLLGNELRKAVLPTEASFPVDAKAGQFCFINKIVYMCVEITSGMPAWVPLTKVIDTYMHTQDVAALEWTIPHNLDSNVVLVQAFVDGKLVMPTEIDCSEKNVVHVRFNMSVSGRAVVMLGEPFGSQRPAIGYTTTFNSVDEVTVNHGLGYQPIIQVINGNGQEVQPTSIVHLDNNTTVLTFSASLNGTVRCI